MHDVMSVLAGINVDGLLIKTMMELSAWHLELLKLNELLQYDANVMYLAGNNDPLALAPS